MRAIDPEELTMTTLENVLYMTMKNDSSFVIGDVGKLPLPRRMVFYNGKKEEPDRIELT